MEGLQSRVVNNAIQRGVVLKSREEWGTAFPDLYMKRLELTEAGHWGPFREKADTLVQHITVTRDDGQLSGDFFMDMREVERIGFERFGSGFSYNFGVDHQTGMVGVGMPLKAKGTHTVNEKGVPGYSYDMNMTARAVAWIGMPGMVPTARAKEKMAQLIAAMMNEGAITREPDYVPHSMFAAKDCPTDSARAAMPWILKRAKEVRA